MQEKSDHPERSNEEARRHRELTEMYGKEKAEEIMRMEKDPAASQFHQPTDQGEQDADVRSAMQNTARRAGGRTPAPMPGDAERQSEGIQDSAEDAGNKGREKREESE